MCGAACVRALLVALCLISATASVSEGGSGKHHHHKHSVSDGAHGKHRHHKEENKHHKELIDGDAHHGSDANAETTLLQGSKHHLKDDRQHHSHEKAAGHQKRQTPAHNSVEGKHKHMHDEGALHAPDASLLDKHHNGHHSHHKAHHKNALLFAHGEDPLSDSLLEGGRRHASTVGLSVRKRPSADSPVVHQLEQGDLFEVSSAHKGPDGAVWLELADHGGWVPQDEVLQVPHKSPHHNRRRSASAHRRLILTDRLEEKPYEKMHMDQSKLPPQIKHVNTKTINADWRNEYPVTPDPTVAPESAAPRMTTVTAWALVAFMGVGCLA